MADGVRSLYAHAYRRYTLEKKGTFTAFGSTPIPRWDGGADAAGKQHKPIWPEIARVCLDHGVDPGRLVQVTFAHWQDENARNNPPTPRELLSPAMLTLAAGVDYQAAADSLKWQMDLCNVELVILRSHGYTDVEAVEQLVGDKTLDFTPLYRYCVACMTGAKSVADECRRDAIVEYLFNREAYDREWAEILPDDFSALSQRLLPRTR